jgi:capsular exopolysaccharide synthesis family protein
MTDTPSTIDLRQYWNVFRSRKFWIIIPMIVGAGLALAYGETQPRQYTAQAVVRVDPPVIALTGGSTKANAPDMTTEQQTASSTAVAALAQKALRTTASTETLLSHLHVAAAATGNIMTIQYKSSSAQQAAQYANAFARAYLAYRNSSIANPLTHLLRQKQYAVAQLLARMPHAGKLQRIALADQLREDESQIAQYQSARQLISGGAVISAAVPPRSLSSRKIPRDLAIGLGAGLVLGILGALIRESLDNRIKNREELEARLRVPVLATIPRLGKGLSNGSLATLSDPRNPASDGYRMAATALQALAARDKLRVIMVASPRISAQSSVTTANLGIALAQAGHRVVLISADMRFPMLHHIFGLSNELGLSTARHEGRSAQTLVQETSVPNLYVLPSGPEPRNPGALLASPVIAEVLSSLQSLNPDFVLVDAPALLASSEALVIAARVDGTVVVWNAEDSDASALVQARERLEAVGANVVGGIYSFDGRGSRKPTAHRDFYEADGHGNSLSAPRGLELAVGRNGRPEPDVSRDKPGRVSK